MIRVEPLAFVKPYSPQASPSDGREIKLQLKCLSVQFLFNQSPQIHLTPTTVYNTDLPFVRFTVGWEQLNFTEMPLDWVEIESTTFVATLDQTNDALNH